MSPARFKTQPVATPKAQFASKNTDPHRGCLLALSPFIEVLIIYLRAYKIERREAEMAIIFHRPEPAEKVCKRLGTAGEELNQGQDLRLCLVITGSHRDIL